MKKLLVTILAVVMAFTCCACGLSELPSPPPLPGAEDGGEQSAEPEQRDPIVLDVILFDRGDGARELFLEPGADGLSFAERFERENPDIRLKLEFVPQEEMPQLLSERIAAGELPDVVNIEDPSALVSEGLLLPAAEYCPEELYADFYPAFSAASEVDGAVWALPDLAHAEALWCDLDLLEEAGVEPPRSWAELEEACAAILEYFGGEVIPLGLDMTAEGAASCFARFTWSGGGGFLGADGDWALDSAENAEALAFAFSLVGKDCTNPNPVLETQEELRELFAAGRLAMLPDSCELPAFAAEQGAAFRMAAAAFPAAEGAVGSAPAGADRLAVLRGADAEEDGERTGAIVSFLRFFYDPAYYASRAEQAGLLPASRSAAARFAASDPSLAGWPEALEGSRFLPSGSEDWDELCLGIAALEQLCLIGGEIPAGLDALQAEFAS